MSNGWRSSSELAGDTARDARDARGRTAQELATVSEQTVMQQSCHRSA
jgi:hypothetical protein